VVFEGLDIYNIVGDIWKSRVHGPPSEASRTKRKAMPALSIIISFHLIYPLTLLFGA